MTSLRSRLVDTRQAKILWLVGILSALVLVNWTSARLRAASAIDVRDVVATSLVTADEKSGAYTRNDPAKVMGISAADCKKCHPSEVAAWMKTVHFQSPDMRLHKFEGNTKKYAMALGISQGDLLKDSLCADCHATKAVRDGEIKVVSGVSCESCHGAAGGSDGWLNRHQSYHNSMPITRQEETPEHRAERVAFCDSAGMIRSENIYGFAKNCFGCHMVGNEKLIAAGHKSASAFNFVSWSSGEVRHNFLVDKAKNEAAPSLWMERTGGEAAQRRRVKFVVGAMVEIETALRLRAQTKNPLFVAQIGGVAAAAHGKFAQISALAATPETQSVGTIMLPLLGTLFVPMPNDSETYNAVADKISEQAMAFAKNNDGSKLQALDAVIAITPAHFSQQYKEKYGTP